MKKLTILIFIVILFSGCFGAGTHGSINSYIYPIKKNELQQAIDKVINENDNIKREDTTVRDFIIDITDGKNDTLNKYNHFNDGKNYFAINVETNEGLYEYTYSYGDESDLSSSISIVYAHDPKGKGGSEGNGDVSWYTPLLKKRLLKIFERELIEKVDKKLGVVHIEE